MSEPTPTGGRGGLAPPLSEHARRLAAEFGAIAPGHREAGESLARWIAEHHRPGLPLHIIVVCTGNSRRSILGSSMGNLAAAFSGMPEVRFRSGGTDPTAFNPRTIAALRAIGFSIQPTGEEASAGNPIHRVSWGAGLEALEFSKRYDDPSNPRGGFAALMVCNEADAGCPAVAGAGLRLAMPFDDPKAFDDEPCEPEKYAERRDEIGRLMLFVMARALALSAKASE